jgi:uncharacterized membrane protein YhaH (DUF805 family)
VTAYLGRIGRSAAFYPVTIVYLGAVLAVVAIVGGVLKLEIGLAILGFVALLVVSLSMRGDVRATHVLVNSKHDALLGQVTKMGDRIEQLLEALKDAKVSIPHDTQGVDRERQRER